MWMAKCYSCGFEDVGTHIFDMYWNDEDEKCEECECPKCNGILDVDRC